MKARRPALEMPGAHAPSPAIDAPPHAAADLGFPGLGDLRVSDRLVVPEITRDEVVRGHRVNANPAGPEHGDPHCRIDYVVTAHLAEGYVASTDMLTRFTEESDFATDTSVRRVGIDPATNERYLEEVAFEVVNAQKLAGLKGINTKAPEILARGVRRMFAVFVRRGVLAEWKNGDWAPLQRDDTIADPVFARPVPVLALLAAAEADNAVARALYEKGNPVIRQVEERGRREGRQEGEAHGRKEGILQARREAVVEALEERGIQLSDDLRAQIHAIEDPWILKRLLRRAMVATAEDDLFPGEH